MLMPKARLRERLISKKRVRHAMLQQAMLNPCTFHAIGPLYICSCLTSMNPFWC